MSLRLGRVVLAAPLDANSDLRRVIDARFGRVVGSGEPYDTLMVDEWTAETSPLVDQARAAGRRLTSLADLVLDASVVPVAGVTGTAGKTTTSHMLVNLLRAAGFRPIHSQGRAANLWPDADLIGAAATASADAIVVAELTSTHLAYMTLSPSVAVVTNLWPDHLELHGSFDAYMAAKRRIVSAQHDDDWAVLNRDDDATNTLSHAGDGRRAWFSTREAVTPGVYLTGGEIVASWGGTETPLGPRATLAVPVMAAMAACSAALCLGADPTRLAAGLRTPLSLPHRSTRLGAIGGVEIIDDGMAATPTKTAAAVRLLGRRRAVMIIGGDTADVHRDPLEQDLLEQACAEARRHATILFGPAADRVRGLLEPAAVCHDLAAAVDAALGLARPGQTIIFSPMFPVYDKELFVQLVRDAGLTMHPPD